MSKKDCYVIWNSQNRWGEFEFCCKTQENYVTSLKDARQEILNCDVDEEEDRKFYRIFKMKLTHVPFP